MKTFNGINYAFRPESYWNDTTVQQAILRGIKGTKRRQLIANALSEGTLEKLGDELQSAEVSDEVRDQLGRIHPSLMGGEYLPSYQRQETEIVRIELESTTSDVISIRGRCWKRRIRYRVVDEYQETFEVKPATSQRPFTLGQLIRFIDRVSHQDLWGPFSLAYNELNADGGTERRRLRHFTRISSDIYPQLHDHFEHVFTEWVREADADADLEEAHED
ncbi:MAG: hypothetical protein FJ379_06395 [Verrucomicrobia bacterium]|nr:hypothetical protein [Verrucomicrobiota bacterium]